MGFQPTIVWSFASNKDRTQFYISSNDGDDFCRTKEGWWENVGGKYIQVETRDVPTEARQAFVTNGTTSNWRK